MSNDFHPFSTSDADLTATRMVSRVKEFLASGERNAWLDCPQGIFKLYVRRSTRLLCVGAGQQMVPTLDLANLEIAQERQKQGILTLFLKRLLLDNEEHLYVESILSDHAMRLLKRLGFAIMGEDTIPSAYRFRVEYDTGFSPANLGFVLAGSPDSLVLEYHNPLDPSALVAVYVRGKWQNFDNRLVNNDFQSDGGLPQWSYLDDRQPMFFFTPTTLQDAQNALSNTNSITLFRQHKFRALIK